MTKVAPQGAALLAIPSNVLIDAFVADAGLGDNLLWAPVLGQTGLHYGSAGGTDARSRAGRVAARCALPLRLPCLIAAIVARIAAQLPAGGRGPALDLAGNLLGAETTGLQLLNLVAFVLAKVRVDHALLHLTVKPRRLPRLRRSTTVLQHFKVEFVSGEVGAIQLVGRGASMPECLMGLRTSRRPKLCRPGFLLLLSEVCCRGFKSCARARVYVVTN